MIKVRLVLTTRVRIIRKHTPVHVGLSLICVGYYVGDYTSQSSCIYLYMHST